MNASPASAPSRRKFDGYVPRQEPADGLAGGRTPRLDRVEWTIIPDPATAANAMTTGEQDYWEYPLHDLLPLLRRNREVVVQQRLLDRPLRHLPLQPPAAALQQSGLRRAVAMAVDQRDYMRAVAGNERTAGRPARASSPAAPPSPTRPAATS